MVNMASERFIWGTITTGAVIVLLVLLGQQEAVESSNGLWSTADDPHPLSLECLDHGNLFRHDHVTLKIFIEDERYTIPENLGINTGVCNKSGENMHTVHTHSPGERLHIEMAEADDVPLGVFFDIWGVHFDDTGIFDYRVNSTHGITMHVFEDGQQASESNQVASFDDYVLLNGEIIEIYFQEI